MHFVPARGHALAIGHVNPRHRQEARIRRRDHNDDVAHAQDEAAGSRGAAEDEAPGRQQRFDGQRFETFE
jgi:hypothetical protein